MPMTNEELRRLGEEVRKQGGQGPGAPLTDLVYDEETGEFRSVAKGEAPASGEIVTKMTEEGFAA